MKAGLIERERVGQDRRIVHLRLTPAGVDRVAEERWAHERELLAGLVPTSGATSRRCSAVWGGH